MCRPEKWDSMPNGFDNTWGIVRESGVPLDFILTTLSYFCMYLTSLLSLAFSSSPSANY